MLAAQRAQASLSIAAVYFSLLLLKHGRRVSVLCPSRAQRNTEMFSILYFEGCKSVKAAIVLLKRTVALSSYTITHAYPVSVYTSGD